MHGNCGGCGRGLAVKKAERIYQCTEKCCVWCGACTRKHEGHGGIKCVGEVMSEAVTKRIQTRAMSVYGLRG